MRGFRSALLASVYDRAMLGVERRCLAGWRAELLAPLSGRVLEIGSGTGVNLNYYPVDLEQLVLCEPDAAMRHRLRQNVARRGRAEIDISCCSAEQIDYPGAHFDFIVSTLVLCSVGDIDRTLEEIRRLLKPGGALVVMEHVRDDARPSVAAWQRRLEPLWRWCAGNCHLTRPTAQILQRVGFETDLDLVEMCGVPGVVRPVIKGTARKSSC
ncbi:MAG: hypothetical protein C0618_03610 [Desulfuromonas sp.]|nr:MAG: hypothetical protein C0618_03610 [Desulfuromonas sp.]